MSAPDVAPWRRQTSQTSEKGPQAQPSCESTPGTAVPNNCSNAAAPPAPPAPAPPPPPPPTMNGTIPTIRLKSEISDRCEPPAKIQNAMMKDKKPFTYTPGGIDLSEIKSPRMQRRIMNNAQTPDDIILPTPTPHVNPSTLPPSAVAAMTPQIAIPVFPQNGLPKKPSHNINPPQTQSPQKQPVAPSPPPPQPPKQTMTPPPPPQRRSVSPTPMQQNQQPGRTVVVTSPQSSQTPVQQNQPGRTVVVTNSQSSPIPQHPASRTIVVNSQPNQPTQQNQQPNRTIVITNSQPEKPKDQPRAQVGSIYVPPVTNETVQNNSKPSFPVLREAPTPWLQKNQQAQEDKTPAWVNRNKNNGEGEQKEVIYERKPRVQQVQNEKEFSESDKPVAGTRVIPIQIEGSNQTNLKASSQRWGTPVNNNQTVLSNQNNVSRGSVANSNKSFNEPDSKPIQSRSFKVIQRITGSEDDNVDYSSEVPYNTENLPLSQLRRLQFGDDDQAFMNKVKSQVDEDIFLHSETDPRYRGSAIPSKAFRKLQNMTDSGQVIPITIEVQAQEKPRPVQTQAKDTNDEPQKKYIPPSERQAEQDLRKYMGSSIPSRSFRMLQAMTSTQPNSQHTKRIDNIDEDARFLYPNPWPDPPKTLDEIGPFWIDYMYLYNLVANYFPYELCPDLGDFEDGNSGLKADLEDSVSDFHRDEYSENEIVADSRENLPDEAVKEELIIDEVVKDDSDHEVSLTICIPLRRKSKSVEYHEEVTIKGLGEVTKEDPISSSKSPTVELDIPVPLESPKTSMEPDTDKKRLEFLDSKQPNSSDTEHSESSSVDFWKDIATDEDVYFKSRSVTPGAEPRPRSVAYDDETDEDGSFKPNSTGLGSQICDEVDIDKDGYFQLRPKTPGFDGFSGSPICDEKETNQNEDFDSIPKKSDYDELAAGEDRYFNLRKSALFQKRSESPPWFQNNTDQDGYFQSRPKTPGLDRNSRSPSICDELTSNQDSKLGPASLGFEEPLESANCDDLTNEQDRFFVSKPKTPGFGRRSVSPPWDWDEIRNDDDGPLEPTEEYFNSNRYQESADYDEDLQSKSRPKTPGPKSSSFNNLEDTLADPNRPEPGQDSWNLGQDIKNYCAYTSMDSESSSSSSGSAEDLDEPFENSSNSSSSDENDSYNVYEFSTNIPAPPAEPEPPIPQPAEIQPAANDRDDDSGMSDTGKGIQEPETLGTELRKLTKYQRANTHSRLLRILQEEEDKQTGKSELTVRKESLTLPLAPNPWLTESVSSSSGINSPLSPVVNEKLVNELVQSLLNSKGLGYHKLPAEKLREAAIKSLYESCSDTSRACSPYNCSTDKSKLTSQDGDTSQTDCYDSYDENSVYYPGFDIFPSRAFKNLQSGRSTPLNWPKCPLLQPQSPDPTNPTKLNSTQDATHDR